MEGTSQTPVQTGLRAGEPLSIERLFTTPAAHPFDSVQWELRDARIGHGAKIAFEQRGVEFPETWSQNSTNIVAQKYFRGQLDTPAREHSVKQMVGRVAGTIADWGRSRGYFASVEDGDSFEAELAYILVHQMAAFNSPVWFNVGFEESPQCSACFILSVQDNMDSILDWNTREGRIFLGGSGSGINLSNIRSSKEPLTKGGTASGPVSFMRGADSWAGTIKSGGKTRRVHLVQGQGGEEGQRAARRRLRHVDRRRGLHLDPVPERQQLGAADGRVHAGGRERRGLAPHRAHDGRAGRRPDPRA